MYRKAILTSVAALALAASLAAKPNFSGTWTLNVSKSDFGMLPGPTSRTDVIEHNDPALKDTVTQETQQGPQNATLNYTTDGKEATNEQGPMTVTSTLSWDGDSLVVNSKTSIQGNDITIKQVWTLSADGKTLTQNAHLAAAALGETDQKLVFEKGSGAAPAPTAAPTAAAPATATASTGAHANYSGTWKLNVDKSDFGPLPPSNSRTDIIDHNDPALKDTVSDDGAQGKQDYVLNITTDGKEATNSPGGLDAKSIANWDGPNLVVETKLSFQGTDVAIKAVWILSADGKTLTQNSHLNAGPIGEADQKFIFEKQ
ncbi:MAG TPA: hypothetical protein VMH05_13370 [Bryobacteraceae bacterium]|nr:hypothetical protein [Bryobacteraceae bacterium]